jgi:hypothetical protein
MKALLDHVVPLPNNMLLLALGPRFGECELTFVEQDYIQGL